MRMILRMPIPTPATRVEHPSNLLKRHFNACLLRPADLRPSCPEMEVIGVFNPGAVQTDDGIVLLVRVAEQPVERRMHYTPLPRWDAEQGKCVVDWIHKDDHSPVDVRVIRQHRDALVRLTFISHLRVFYSRDGRTLEARPGAQLEPENAYEEYGVEDPRITPIGDTFYITYVAISRHGVATALPSTRDFKSFQRHGSIFC